LTDGFGVCTAATLDGTFGPAHHDHLRRSCASTEVVVLLVVLIIIGMVLLVTCAALWPEPEDGARLPRKPSTPEGALARRLLDGEIDRQRYRAEQARLAARDAERHPLAIPDDRL
jgi:hypothetical protein